ncbi:MAG: hypothetical protein JSW26_19080 [Desulfobacterales bacterium]|nr:MAG: hypothetical protein JSW26_19080 [Desulfobacterales bacterium]
MNSNNPIYRQGVYHPAKSWRERQGRYRLMGSRCTACGALFFPRCQCCSRCGGTPLAPYQCTPTGRVIAGWSPAEMTTPSGYGNQMPRYVVLVRLDDGVHIKGEVVDIGEDQLEPAMEGFDLKKPREGLRVQAVLRRLRRESTGSWLYGFKFVPCHDHDGE